MVSKNNQNQKPIEKKFARLAARAVFASSFLLQKQLIYDFLAGNNYPNSPHLQGDMTFTAQISPLLNLTKLIIRSAYKNLFHSLTCYNTSNQFEKDFDPNHARNNFNIY